MQGLAGQYDRGVTGLDSSILPPPPVFVRRLANPTATLVALIEIEAFLLELDNVVPPLDPPGTPTGAIRREDESFLLREDESHLLREDGEV